MTMLSFRVDAATADAVDAWSARLGVDRSALLRESLHRHLVRLQSELDVDIYGTVPLTDSELALADAADWGPAEDWSDWRDASR